MAGCITSGLPFTTKLWTCCGLMQLKMMESASVFFVWSWLHLLHVFQCTRSLTLKVYAMVPFPKWNHIDLQTDGSVISFRQWSFCQHVWFVTGVRKRKRRNHTPDHIAYHQCRPCMYRRFVRNRGLTVFAYHESVYFYSGDIHVKRYWAFVRFY